MFLFITSIIKVKEDTTKYALEAIFSEALSQQRNLSVQYLERVLTLRHLGRQIVRLLSTDMYPVEVIIQVLVVVTGSGTIVERTSP